MTTRLQVVGGLVRLWWHGVRWPLIILCALCVALFLLDRTPQDEAAKIVFAVGIAGACIGSLSSPIARHQRNGEFFLTRPVSRTTVFAVYSGLGLVAVVGLVAALVRIHFAGVRQWVQADVLGNPFFPHVRVFEGRVMPFAAVFAVGGYCVGLAATRIPMQGGTKARGIGRSLITAYSAVFMTCLVGMLLYSFSWDLEHPMGLLGVSAFLALLVGGAWLSFRCDEELSISAGRRQWNWRMTVYPLGLRSPLSRGIVRMVGLAAMLALHVLPLPVLLGPVAVTFFTVASQPPRVAEVICGPSARGGTGWAALSVLCLASGVVGFRDAKRRGHSALGRVGAGVLCATLVGWLVYLAFRRQGGLGRCRQCALPSLVWVEECPHCGQDFAVMRPRARPRPPNWVLNPAVAAALGLIFVCPVFFVMVPGSAVRMPWYREFIVLDARAPGVDVHVNGRRVGQSPVAVELVQFADRFLFDVASSAPSRGAAQSSDGRTSFSIASDKADIDRKLEPFRRMIGRGPYPAEFRYRGFVGKGTLRSVTVDEAPVGRSARFQFDVRFPELEAQVQRLAAKARLDGGQVCSGWFGAVEKLGVRGLAALCAEAHYWWPGQLRQILYDDCPMGDPVLCSAVDQALRRHFRIGPTDAGEDPVTMAERIMVGAAPWDQARFPNWQQALLLLGEEAAPAYRARIVGARAAPFFHRLLLDPATLLAPGQSPDDAACVMLAKTAPENALGPLVWASRGRWLFSEPQFEAIAWLGTDEAAHFIGRMLVSSSGVPFFMRKLLMRRGAKGIAALVATKNPVALDYLRRARRLPQFQDVGSSAAILAGLIQFGDDRAVEEAVPPLLKATAQPAYVDAVVPALAARGDKKCVHVLARVLRESRYKRARQAAGWNLARPKSLEALEALRRTLDASEKDSLASALRGLSRRDRPDSNALLLSIAEDRNTDLKMHLARLVAKEPHRVPFDVCVKLAKAADPEVRTLVSEALWRLASRRGMALLATMTNDPDKKVRATVKERLNWLREVDGMLRARAQSPD